MSKLRIVFNIWSQWASLSKFKSTKLVLFDLFKYLSLNKKSQIARWNVYLQLNTCPESIHFSRAAAINMAWHSNSPLQCQSQLTITMVSELPVSLCRNLCHWCLSIRENYNGAAIPLDKFSQSNPIPRIFIISACRSFCPICRPILPPCPSISLLSQPPSTCNHWLVITYKAKRTKERKARIKVQEEEGCNLLFASRETTCAPQESMVQGIITAGGRRERSGQD